MSIKEEIEALEKQNVALRKQILYNESIISKIRMNCKHKYEVTHIFGDGDYELTCIHCNDRYIH